MKEIIEALSAHKAALSVVGMWLVRETPLIWQQVVKIYPYVSSNGGIFGLAKNFFAGKQQETKKETSTP